MKKSKEETAKTRELIVKTAADEFRKNGLQMGMADVMAAAGLTQGGFYRHFASKDELVAEAMVQSLSSLMEMLQGLVRKNPGNPLKAVVKQYLSPGHLDHPAGGCAFALLGSEIARSDNSSREAVSDCYTQFVDMIASLLPDTVKDRRVEAQLLVSSMIGAVVMSRIPTDRAVSRSILNTATSSIIEKYCPDK